jgi:hypothetical protein
LLLSPSEEDAHDGTSTLGHRVLAAAALSGRTGLWRGMGVAPGHLSARVALRAFTRTVTTGILAVAPVLARRDDEAAQ